MNNREIKREISEVEKTYEKSPTDSDLLHNLFLTWHGLLFSSPEKKHGVGIYPDRAGFVVEFFEILDDKKFKYIDRRCITITNFSKEKINHIVNICEIINNTVIERDSESFDYA